MSEDTNQEPQVLYTQEGINARRKNLYDLTSAINKHESVLDEYHFSKQRIGDLKQARQKYIKKRTSLEGKNKILLGKISKEPLNLSQFKDYENNLTSLLNTNQFLQPNVKIVKIVGYVGSEGVNGLKLELSDTGVREYGYFPPSYTGSSKAKTPLEQTDTPEFPGMPGMPGTGETPEMDDSQIIEPYTNSMVSGNWLVEYSLEPTEFIIKIDKIDSSTAGTLGNALIFYTSSGRKHIIKGKDTEIDPSKFSEEKIFVVNPVYQRWEWHEQNARKNGYTLASIADHGEGNKISNLLRKHGYGSAWAGGRRHRRGRSRGADNWRWVDGTPWKYTTAWGGGEPNDCCGGENYLQINMHGRWNDLFPYNLPAVYSKISKRYTINSVTSGGSDMEIIGINSIRNLSVETDEQYTTDTKAIDNLESLQENIDSLIANLEHTTDDSKIEYSENLTIIQDINELVDVIDEQIKDINEANNYGNTSTNILGFTNMGDKVNHFFNNIFSNNKSMKEGFKEGATGAQGDLNSPFYDYLMRIFSDTRYSINDELAHTDNLEYEENRNYMLELLAQKKQVASNVLMDYMINDTEGSNAEQLYETMNQENLDKKRKIKINDYYSKTYLEYSHILKTIILLIAIMIPFLILTKYDLLDKNISLTVVIIISFLGFLYVLHRLYLLYMKDNINFDKDRIPYDRQAAELIKEGRIKQKTGLQGLGITCIGEECCSDNMVYDATKHKCYPLDPTIPSTTDTADGFTNFFETMNNMNNMNNKKSNVVQNNMHEDPKEYTYIKEPFMTSSLDARRVKSDMIIDSLNYSTENNMYFNKQ